MKGLRYDPKSGMGFIIYLQDEYPGVGSGERPFIVLSVGHKAVTLFYVPTLSTVKIPVKVWDTLRRVRPWAPSLGWLEKILADKQASFDRHSLQYSGIAARKALEVVRVNAEHAP